MANAETSKVQIASKCAHSRFGTVCKLSLDKCALLCGFKSCVAYDEEVKDKEE
jgi:hypothetical protein